MARTIKGLDSLLIKMEGLDNAIKQEVEKEMNKALLPVKVEAISIAPFDTGALSRSITIRTEITDTSIIGKVGAYIHYAKYLEFGTSKMEAQPFLKPAFDTHKMEVAEDIKRRIQKVIREKVGE